MTRALLIIPMMLSVVHPRPASAQPAAPLDSLIGAYVREHDFSGTILVQRGGQGLYRRSFGVAERAFGTPADDSTRYRIASITKLFTSVLVLQLHQEGRLDVNATIGTVLPDYPGEGADRVTIHQLLNHTSGLENFDRERSFQEAVENGIERYQKPHTSDALLARCCGGRLAGEPGAAFAYNNADYIVLGKIIERVTGKPYAQVLEERILRPLGMRDTGMMRYDTILPRLASTYFYPDDTGKGIPDLPVYWENWYAAGGMYSTAADLRVFADALFGGDRLLGEDARQRLLTPALDEYGYGLWSYSFERGGRRYRVAKRPGSIMGVNTVLYRLLDQDATIILLANTNRADLDELAQRIANVLVR
ncbi:MAG TPA: serine hydrolase domain-containing protein [Longimicrobium sp.]|nr:serine hydrolase domain-containing protein [Longimicrobium sp.]